MLHDIRLHDFRCFAQLGCRLDAGINLFTGANAQGKTSLLEAVCVLMRLHSPRARRRGELARFGARGFGLAGRFGGRELKHRFDGATRVLTIDGEPVEQAKPYLQAGGRIVWMGNEDLDLVRGPGEVRRRYLDFAGSQLFPEYLPTLRRFDKALRSRNRLLREGRPDPRTLDAYTRPFVEEGERLAAWRAELLERLAPFAAAAHGEVGGGLEALGAAYRASATPGSLAEAVEASAAADVRRGLSLVGPHRDDFELLVDGRPAARFASEGQQRTVALALKLGQGRLLEAALGAPPILLIDDVFGELDPDRRNRLLRHLPAGSQKLITTTHLAWADEQSLTGRQFRVAGGTVVPVD